MSLDDDVRELVDDLLRRWWDAMPPTALSDAERVYLRREQEEYRRRAQELAGRVFDTEAQLEYASGVCRAVAVGPLTGEWREDQQARVAAAQRERERRDEATA